MNTTDTTELLQALLAADESKKKAALRLLRGAPVAASQPAGPIFVTGAGAARMLGVGRTTFRRWAQMAGVKPAEVFPRCFRYRRHEVEEIARKAMTRESVAAPSNLSSIRKSRKAHTGGAS